MTNSVAMLPDAPTLHAIAAIIAAIIWPTIAVGLIVALFPIIKSIIKSRGFSVKFGNVEVSVQDATDQFQKQLNDLNEQVGHLRAALEGPAPANATALPQPEPPPPPARPASILWVDDKPEGNALEVAQLKDRSIEVVQVRSTSEAMSALGSGAGFAAVVSDMGRTEQDGYRGSAGLELLAAMRAQSIDLPFFVYTGRRSAITTDAAVKAADGDGATASTIRLFEWINQQVKRSR